MRFSQRHLVLGSRSPRRRDLIASLVSSDQLTILPPRNSEEPGFEDVQDEAGIGARLRSIVSLKHQDVCAQSTYHNLVQSEVQSGRVPPFVVVADTTVIASRPDGSWKVLGQPDPRHWKDEVRTWLRDYLSGRTHQVWTCCCVSCDGLVEERIVQSEVTFVPLTDAQIEWYLSTEESLGKAGGYAIQGYGAALVSRVTGSLTNVIGLPLLEIAESLQKLDARIRGRS